MRPKTLALLCVAVGCGLVAMIGVQQALNKPAVADVAMVSVLEAQMDIDPGVPLTEENVALREIARDSAPEDAVTSLEEYQKRSLTVAVVKGEYILKSKLSEQGVSGKSTQIPPGKTVVTINVDETQTHSNMMKAGDYVDVSVTYDARTATGSVTKTMTLLERVIVFAIADQTKNDMVRRTDNASIKARQVSLIVNYDEANSLVLAETKGQLRLMWRNPSDMQRHNTKAITESLLTELRGLDQSEPAPAVAQSEMKESTPVVETKVEEPEPDVHQFLSQPAPIEKPAAPEVVEAPVPEKPMWEVKVYVGNEVQTFPFELKEEPRKAAKSAGETVAVEVEEPKPTKGGLLEKLGWSLKWRNQGAANEEQSKAGQAL